LFCYERRVRFADVDVARMVFFARFCEYCHEALEGLFETLDGGYERLVMVRDIGIPTVHIDLDYKAPLRYGDVAIIEVDVLKVGKTSITFRHTIRRKGDGTIAAVARHVVVTAKMAENRPLPVPGDVRALLQHHLAATGQG
jgi:4-hydroxybenzoyl-CoA thioesterase